MRKREKQAVALTAVLSLALCGVPSASAMHIMEGYLPPSFCVIWGVICLPFLAAGVLSIRRIAKEQRKAMLLLAMAGAFVFVISSLKIPSVTGSCSHMTGTGLAAILFGVPATAVLGVIVLVFQAILLAHGGLTTLGANTFSMAIAGPFVSFGVYKLCQKLKVNRMVSVGIACALGDLFTYCVTSVQLALAHPGQEGVLSSMAQFMGVFALTQVPLAIVEGILSAIVIMMLESFAKPELREIGFLNKEAAKV